MSFVVKSIKPKEKSPEDVKRVVIYGDTDSVYINFGHILKSVGYAYDNDDIDIVKNFIIYGKEYTNEDLFGKGEDDSGKQIGGMDRSTREDLEETAKSLQNFVGQFINKSMIHLTTKKCNCKENKIFFKREAVARSGCFLQRKRYVCWVLNNEGVECNKLKSTGVEIVRSSTPLMVQKSLKNIVLNILKSRNEKTTEKEVREFREQFMNMSPEQIAKPSSVNKLDEWSAKMDKGNSKSCPIHVKSAYFFNRLINSNPKLKNKYEPIREGDKMKWVYTKKGARWEHGTIGFKDKWPKEFKLEDHIDYEQQFQKVFLGPLDQFYKIMNWNLPDLGHENIEDLFAW